MPGLTRSGNGVESPFALPRGGVVCVNESAYSVLAAGDSDDDQILYCQRCPRKTVSSAIIRGDHIPHHRTALCVERDHVRIQRPEIDLIAEDCQPSIYMSAAWSNVAGDLALVHPDGPSRAGVEREGAVILRGCIENSVDGQRRSLQFSGGSGLVYPLRNRGARIGDVDLIQGAETLAGVIALVRHPVLRFLRGVQQPIERDLRESVSCEKGCQKESRQETCWNSGNAVKERPF